MDEEFILTIDRAILFKSFTPFEPALHWPLMRLGFNNWQILKSGLLGEQGNFWGLIAAFGPQNTYWRVKAALQIHKMKPGLSY